MTDGRGGDRGVTAMRAAVIAAAIHHRDTMRRYMAEQAAAIAGGISLDDLVTGNWPSFQETVASEGRLFSLLDTLEAMQAGAEQKAQGVQGGG
jgi:hypothetical protein